MKDVFAGARALPASERHAYLSAACAGNEALRQEVESLLASDERAKSFLESPAVVRGDGTPHPAQLMIEGRRLGAYQVQALLGAGGMGEVYRARDTKLQRDVAVKFLPHAFTSDPERLSRFEGEARMLAALNHPNIGAIYGFEEADGLRFLVLELVDGQTLADKLADVSRQRARSRPADSRRVEHRGANRRGSRCRSRKRDHPPRSEARQHQDHAGGSGEGPRLWPGEDRGRCLDARPHAVADDAREPHQRRRGPGHGRIHEPRAGAGSGRRQTDRHLGIRMRPVRNAHRPRRVQGRLGVGHHRGRPWERAGVGRPAARNTNQRPSAAAAMP